MQCWAGEQTLGPLQGPATINISPGMTIQRLRSQVVPDNAPMGVYEYMAYAVVGHDTTSDSFLFAKSGSPDDRDFAGNWANQGEPFDEISFNLSNKTAQIFILEGNSPNPFNSQTLIRYMLPTVSNVNLVVYDISGRLVVSLVNGWRDAGSYEVAFDGSGLTNGVYFVKLTYGGQSHVQKLMLIK
jgi:hypothetical protein